jgi:hypothetical protein
MKRGGIPLQDQLRATQAENWFRRESDRHFTCKGSVWAFAIPTREKLRQTNEREIRKKKWQSGHSD